MTPTSVAPLTDLEDALLQELARIALTLPRDFTADLGRAAGVSLSEYHVLMHLAGAPGHMLRVGALARRTGLTLGAVTRVMRLLEDKGLAARRRSAEDGRGQDALLTDPGRERLAQASPVHTAGARRYVLDRLDPSALATLVDALRRIGDHDRD
ncbi:MarR family winged helix-turn-helix transcriptional regulator [Demequina iriomotensis]|uniref:MarR family winged helix-turn-helix transcriptional regulator n=1 Tax=Demequina iriomotensis TaxID=1536641 RepID=UPI000784F8FC|nr:MarR family transcriptional regulator [Demequina iriomotensis]